MPTVLDSSAFARERHISITTFRRDGTSTMTPVWCAGNDGSLLVFTEAESWKVRRIRRDPHVRVAPCSVTGRLRGAAADADAVILEETAEVEELLAQKYGLAWRSYRFFLATTCRLRRRPPPASVTLRITLR